jgi:hypothetical protein
MTSLQKMSRERVLDDALALAEGSGRTIESFLSPDVGSWFASREQGLFATIEPLRGAKQTADALARLAPSDLTVVAAVCCVTPVGPRSLVSAMANPRPASPG